MRILPNRSRDADAENLEDRYRGIVSLPKMLLRKNEARNLEAERWAAEEARAADVNDAGPRMSHGAAEGPTASSSARLAQSAIRIPRIFPVPPPLLYNGNRGSSPPRGPGPQNPRKPKKQCDAEYAANIAACKSLYPPMELFPAGDIFREKRFLCNKEADRVFSDCRTGRDRKPFDPKLYFEEDD